MGGRAMIAWLKDRWDKKSQEEKMDIAFSAPGWIMGAILGAICLGAWIAGLM